MPSHTSNTVTSPRHAWPRALAVALAALLMAAGLAVVVSAEPALASTSDPKSTSTDESGDLGPFGSLSGEPMNGYRLYEVPLDALMSEYYSIDALGPNGEIAGRSREGDNGDHLTPFVWTPGEGPQWLEPVPYSVNRVGGFDGKGNVYGTAADGTPTVDESVVWKWARTKDGYASPQAIFHGDSIDKDWAGTITAVNAGGDVLLSGLGQPYLLHGGQATALTGLNPVQSYPSADDLNDKGIAVGVSVVGDDVSSHFEPTSWSAGGAGSSLGFPPLVFENAEAVAINNKGEVVVGNPLADQDPWLRKTDGSFTLFGTPKNAPSSSVQQVDDLSDDGVAVGFYQPDGSSQGNETYAARWTRDGQRVQLLDDLLQNGADSGWHLSRAFAINDKGMIAGVGSHDGHKAAWIAVPVDPVVFVHGAGASSLWERDYSGLKQNAWMSCTKSRKMMSLWPEDFSNGYGAVQLRAIDALRHESCFIADERVKRELDIYGSFLDRLRGSYQEYDRHDDPNLQTEGGCDTSQMDGARTPNLFVYAYDWRKDNRKNAEGLADYLKCVHKFWPGSKVDIVTHSMGGLVARRYLLQQGGDDVDRMITIGAPWLGAPKLVNVLQTGDFAPQPVNGPYDVIKHVVGSFPAAHQLAASRVYGDAARLPIMSEMGWDLNGRNGAWEDYSYDDVKKFLDDQNKDFLPGTTGDEFQNENGVVGGQTDWRNESSGIAYTHVVGLQAGANTIGSVAAVDTLQCSGTIVWTCEQAKHVTQRLVCGDGTVPYVSAERAGKGVDYNAPDAEVVVVRSDTTETNFDAEHTGMAANRSIQDAVLRRLFSPMQDEDGDGHRDPVAQDRSGLGKPTDDLGSCYQPPAPAGQGLTAGASQYDDANPAPGTGMRYVSLVGGTGLTVTDSAGKTTDPAGDTVGYVAGVTLYPSDRPDAGMATFPESDTRGFTTSFTGTGDPVQLELLDGSQSRPTRALRWADVPVEDGQAARLRTTADGREVFEVDADGDGTPETPVAPTVKVGGSDAADTVAPTITATRLDTPDGVRFGLAASDAGSGVAALMWSSDGTHFQRYDAPVAAEPGTQLTAFATDRAGNRSAPYEFAVDQVEAGLFTTATVTPAPSAEGWTAGTATVKLQAQAPVGGEVASITYRTTGAAGDHEKTVDGDLAELEVAATGTTTVTYSAAATDGSREPERTAQVRIDQAAPTAAIKRPTPTAVVTSLPAIKGTASDDASGVTGVELELRNGAGKYWDGAAWTVEPAWLGASGTTTWSRSTGLPQGDDLPSGAYRIRVRAGDGAGHSAVVTDSGFTVAATVATTVRRLSVASSSRTSGTAVNEQGVAAGVAAVGDTRGVRWRNGTVEELPVTGSATSVRIDAVDESGAVYGSQLDPSSGVQPVRWGISPSVPTVLPTPAAEGEGEVADATPDGTVLVGWSSTGPLAPHLPVRWVGDRIESLPLTQGATAGEATGVAADGTVVGTLTTTSGRRAVIWPADGGIRNLGTLPNDVASTGAAINDLGTIVGTSTDSNGRTSAFVYADGEMRRIDATFSSRNLQPSAIDNAGTVVGDYAPSAGGETRAFVTGDEGWAEDLGDRLPAGSGWTLITARGVNELGQIIGFGTKDGRYDGYVLGAAHAPLAEDQSAATPKDTAVSLTLTGFDPDVADPVSYEVIDGPGHGALGEITDGEVTYTPDSGFQGTDQFTWRLSDPEYGSVPATVSITVGDGRPDPDPDPDPEPGNPPTIEIAAPASGDEGSAIALHATAADPDGTDLEITWSVTGGVLEGSGSDVILTLPDGPDTVSVSATTSDGTSTVSATADVAVRNAPPTAEAGGDLVVEPGAPVALTGVAGDPSADDAAELTTRWDFGDGTTGSGLEVTHTWATAGEYPVTFTVIDPDGASTTDTVKVTVSKQAAPASVIGVIGVKEGLATLAAYTDGTTSRGTVGWLGKGGPFLAKVTGLERITTTAGRPAAWIDATYGRHRVRVYAESGLWLGQGDVFKLWIDGKLITATGTRTLGFVTIC
jgi:probable HAF family extracellular repeat protein